MANPPAFEIDDRWFTVLATLPNAVITRHNISGNLDVWSLEWKHKAAYPPSFEAEAWAKYLSCGG
jgi:hypothetical protein